MEQLLFYFFSVVSILSTIGVVFSIYPMYALLYLIVSFLSVSCVFFILGAYLAGTLEVIIYAGAIMVLFVFVIMMLNIDSVSFQERKIINLDFSNFSKIKVLFCLFMLLVVLLYAVWGVNINDNYDHIFSGVDNHIPSLKTVGFSLFSTYIIVVEMASMLLLAALIIVFHLGSLNKSLSINKHDIKGMM